ncbi:MAG: transglycosylase SLT domain-containing protein [Cyclobacteriaceae bacterium]
MLKKVFAWVSVVLIVSVLPLCNPAIQSQTSREEAQPAIKNLYADGNLTIQEGMLTALLDNSLSSYFIYRGEPMGFEYELLKLFADDHGLKLKIEIVQDVDNILTYLAEGKGDIAAANLTIMEERTRHAAFSAPIMRTRQVLVQRMPENARKMTMDQIKKEMILDPLDLEGLSVHVTPNSSYFSRLSNFASETNTQIDIVEVDSNVTTDDLIAWVAEGKIDYTIADENRALLHKHYYNNLYIETPVSLSQPIAWAIHKDATDLQAQINIWLENRKGSLEFNSLVNKYFSTGFMPLALRKNQDIIKSGTISQYDDLIKKYAAEIGWDWRLLAALINQESQFNASASSNFGAMGLMQLLPNTAVMFGVDSTSLNDPESNIRAGIGFLKRLEQIWQNNLTDSLEVLKFTLASYNAGTGHVIDARRLAEKHGLNQTIWNENVENMLLRKSEPDFFNDPVVKYGYCRGAEPVHYVENILKKYELYAKFTE